MSRTTPVMTLVVALASVPVIAAGQGNGNAGGRPRIYQEQDAATKTTFTATADAVGNAVLTLKGGDFVLEKVVAHTGDTTLRLSQGKDVVTIALSQRGFEVARGQQALRVDARAANESSIDAVRALLLGSRAVGSFKRLVAEIENRDEGEQDGPLALSTLVDGAVVELIDGNAEATRRIAKRITRKQRGGVRAIKAMRAPGVYYDCVGGYEIALMTAWSQFQSCAIESTEYSWWSRDLVFQLCSWEWALRSYQYIWQFIGCFMVPW